MGRPTIPQEQKRKDYKLHLTQAELAELKDTSSRLGMCPRQYLWKAHRTATDKALTVRDAIATSLTEQGLSPDAAKRLADALSGH